jgi:adenosylcobinamide kinase / adenosylcobinamide-phosphate guanylyltransferase
MAELMTELILGGQRSGKSRCAEQRAAAWLTGSGHSAVLLATALAGDAEMHARIARHQADRATRVPDLVALEVPFELPKAVQKHSLPHQMVVIDCLTLWLTNWLMPLVAEPLTDVALTDVALTDAALTDAAPTDATLLVLQRDLCHAICQAHGPVVLVSNEIGLGLSPLGTAARRFVDELGRLHQAVAAVCPQVTLMVAGLEIPVKRIR